MSIQARFRAFPAKRLSPARVYIFNFAAVILSGALLLWMPFAAGKGPVRFREA